VYDTSVVGRQPIDCKWGILQSIPAGFEQMTRIWNRNDMGFNVVSFVFVLKMTTYLFYFVEGKTDV
jgi:hypothetical protein